MLIFRKSQEAVEDDEYIERGEGAGVASVQRKKLEI